MYSKKVKIIAGVLVFILCMSYVSTITKIGQVLAADPQIEFNPNFDTARRLEQGNTLTTEIEVGAGGYLENARVEIPNANFRIINPQGAKRVYTENNVTVIEYNTISGGISMDFPVEFVPNEKIYPDELAKDLDMHLTATYRKNDGTSENISITKQASLAWIVEEAEGTLTPQVDVSTTKFIPFNINNTKGIIVEQKIITRLPNNALPIKDNKLLISVPKIGGVLPTGIAGSTGITINADSLDATKGDKIGETFSSENYSIKTASELGSTTLDPDDTVILVDVKNEPDADGKVSWSRAAADEFTITYKYPEAAYTAYTSNPDLAPYTVIDNIVDTYYYRQTNKYTNLNTYEIPTTANGKMVDATAEVSKNKLYVTPGRENTISFTETAKLNLSAPTLTDKIILTADVDRYEGPEDHLGDGEIINTYYTNTATLLTQENITKILSMMDVGGTLAVIGEYANGTEETICAYTKTSEGATATTSAPTATPNTNKPIRIRIELTKVVKTGTITIQFNKEGKITPSTSNTKIFTEINTKTIIDDTVVETSYAPKAILLAEPESQAELAIENSTLSTKVLNQNVKLTAILKTNTVETKLYKNPVLKINLPKYIERVDLKNVEVLFDTEASKLTKKSQDVVDNADGSKSILIELQGEQTEYALNAVSKGVNVVITADMLLNKLTTTGQDTITMEYTNNNGTPETKTATANISVVAPVGVITATTVEGYSAQGEAVTVMTGDNTVAITDVAAESRNAKYTMNIVNNYAEKIKNVSILGRFPVSGAKDIETGEDLGTTFNMLPGTITVNGVDASKVKVYYSPIASATTDLTSTYNEWSEEIPQDVKSYLIVLDSSVELNKADGISFTYNASIPSNMQYNQSAYEMYAVYFDNVQDGITGDREIATKLEVTTGKGPILEASLTSDKAEDYVVQAGEIITDTLKVRNTGTETARNTVARFTVPMGLDCVDENGTVLARANQEAQVNLENIEAGQEKTTLLYFKANLTSTDMTTTSLKVAVAEEKGITAETETVRNTIRGVDYQIGSYIEKDKDYLKEGDNFQYVITALATGTNKTHSNTVLEITLPAEIDYKSAKVETEKYLTTNDITNDVAINYDNSSRKLTINLGDVTSSEIKRVYLNVAVGKLADGVYAKEVTPAAKISGTGVEEQRVNIDTVEVGKVGFRIVQTSNIPENTVITAGEDFKYVFTIENLSNMDLYDVKVTDIVPEAVTLGSINAEGTRGSKENSNTNEINLMIKGRETITLTANVAAKILESTEKAVNKAVITYDNKQIAESNTITHSIKKFDKSDYPTPDDSGKGTDPTLTKRIMGTVWEDENTNGARDENEKLISGVQLMLFNNNTGNLVRNAQGEVIRVLTDETGTYTFAGLEAGNYTVIFLYDTANYSSTTYRKEGVDATLNSDGVDTKITIDGTARIVAITEGITVTDKNVYAIDLGLVSNPKFDLKLDKVVSKITVQDSDGTNVITYNDAKVAKKDLVGDKIAGSTIIVEYKLKVTNEGAISGFVKKLADYMPKEMKFNSELNKDWYAANDGTLYNSSLANTLINPGETKEVTLVLTKKMTEDNLGLYHNEAEIYEAYNDLGMADIDSTAGNRKSEEDDISSADVLITVKTGEVAIFIGASIGIIATIAVAAYIIKKKVIR